MYENPFFKELVEYNHHFNQKLADIFVGSPDMISEKAVKLFSHLLNAHHIWNHRIEGKRPIFGVWKPHSISELKDIDQSNYAQTLHILDTVDLDKTIDYSNTSGKAFSNRAKDIVFHIINHSTYHRGQIATEFRQNGLEPLITDYVFYKRLL